MRKSALALSVVLFIGASNQIGAGEDPKAGAALSSFPVAPFSLNLRQIPRFLHQPLPKSSKYSSIDAFLDNRAKDPWYEVILREKGSNEPVYYCNSERTVNLLKTRGDQAYFTQIDFKSSSSDNPDSNFDISFPDETQQRIEWHFVKGLAETGDATGFMARPDDSDFVLMYRSQQFSAAPGTTVGIGDEQNSADENAFYAPDVLRLDLPAITEQWTSTQDPSQIGVGDKWVLKNETGDERQLQIQSVTGDHILLQAQNNDSQGSEMQLDVQTADQLKLASMTVRTSGHLFRVSFNPALPLPAPMTDDKTDAAFTMDEDSQLGVATGRVSAIRGLGDEHIQWHFTSPDWARPKQLTTGVNILPPPGTKGIDKFRKSATLR